MSNLWHMCAAQAGHNFVDFEWYTARCVQTGVTMNIFSPVTMTIRSPADTCMLVYLAHPSYGDYLILSFRIQAVLHSL